MQDTTQADTGRQAGGHRQASSQTSRQTYWQAGGGLEGRDRQTGMQTQAGKQSNTGRQAVRLASKHIRKHSQMHMAMLISTSTIMPQCLGTHTNSRQRPGSRLAANCHATQATLFPNHRHGAPQAQAQGQQHSSVLRTQKSMFSILHGARQGQAGKQAD